MNRKTIELILLALLIAVHIVCNFVWIYSNDNALIFQGKSWQKNLNIYSALENNLTNFSKEINLDSFYQLIAIDDYSPPFYFWLAALLNYSLSVFIPKAMLLGSSLFLIFLIIIVYKMGEYLCKGSGLLSAIICSLYPFIYLNSRFFNMALAVGAMAALSVFILLRTERFEKRGNSILLGVCLGLGMLTKYTFFVFLIGPLIAAVVDVIKKRKEDSFYLKRRNNIVISLFIAALISGVYYFNQNVIQLLVIRGFNLDQHIADMTVLQRAIFYLKNLFIKEIGGVISIFTFGLSIVFFKNKLVFKNIFCFWVIPAFILIAITPKNEPQAEYIIPLLPAIALMSGIVITNIKPKLIKHALSIALLVIMLVQFFLPYYPAKAYCFSKDTQEIKSIFTNIGAQNKKIGYICENKGRDKFLGLETFFSLWSDDVVQVYDFFVSPLEFIENMGDFDYLFYIASQNKEFYNAQKLKDELNGYCKEQGISLIWNKDSSAVNFDGKVLNLSDNIFKELLLVLNKFKKADSFYFSLLHKVEGPYLKINVFSKKDKETFSMEKNFSQSKTKSSLFAQSIDRVSFFNALDSIKILKYAKEPLLSFEIIDKIYADKYTYDIEKTKAGLIFAELIDMARQSYKSGQYRQALKILKRALSLDFDNTIAFDELDELFIVWKEPTEAIIFYQALLPKFAKNEKVLLRLARQYKILQDYGNMGKYYKKVLELDPDCLEAKKGLSNS